MKSLTGPIIKSLIFVAITAMATTLLALTITNGSLGGDKHHFKADFTDVTSVNVGDDVRMAGVRVGQVTSIDIQNHVGGNNQSQAQLSFTVQSSVALAKTVTATIKYENLIGQRYLELDEGAGPLSDPLPSGATITVDRTQPALNLTMLFNGFQPLFQALNPDQINQLAGEIIQVFQGEGPTIENLLTQTDSLTNTLASKDKVIGEVIDNLNAVLKTVNAHGDQLTNLVKTLASFVAGLSADRTSLGNAITGIAGLTTDVGGLLTQARAPLKSSINSLKTLSDNLTQGGELNSFLQTLPTKLTALGRLASYGNWLNFYECSVTVPGGKWPTIPGYYGDYGAQPVASRCH